MGQFVNSMGLKTQDGMYSYPVQIEKLLDISGDYSSKIPFAIKGITDANLVLNVRLYGMDDFITTIIYPGWNIELVSEFKGAAVDTIQIGF